MTLNLKVYLKKNPAARTIEMILQQLMLQQLMLQQFTANPSCCKNYINDLTAIDLTAIYSKSCCKNYINDLTAIEETETLFESAFFNIYTPTSLRK